MEEVLLRFTAGDEEEGRTLREVLQNAHGVSRRLLVKAKYGGEIRINGQMAYVSQRLHKGDVVTVTLPAEQAEHIEPQEMPLAIRYEDDDLLILAKPAGLVVHPTRTHPSGTLANGVIAYYLGKGESRRFRPVNRLDKDTSGLMIIAKNQWAHEQCARMQKERTLRRTYQAIAHGRLAPAEGTIDAPIGLADGSIIERTVRPDGQPARTRYRVLAQTAEMSWVELQLETGRTHQIRVHLRHLGHPLLGDDLYGGSRELIGRQALHAAALSFAHPRTGQPLALTEPLPEDMARLVSRFL
ncbi:RluA family pseudouridine synthase [Brevibacillus sp. SYP-B805]|uniref:RluA family pseudouridine synthase n=1 Tax=Brevibacillus sp. SYP-B805 TaxID=1578199 RepID=UPI0013ECBED1|nr:RluA family pseudouridine synthase [Brevibacillus sp. SYP-B805]NGQ95355.1 RluA family pseudouridine synthase [Brevibacillus sp. SYP-B805]